MEIRTLNRQQLEAFVHGPAFERLPFIPISRHRALSHIANPRATDGDVLLLLAYDGDTMVGYLGVLPDRLHRDGRIQRCGWLSCMWVDDAQRGKGIAKKLLQRAFEAWDDRILVTEFTPAAKVLYDRSGIFRALADPAGLRLYIRSDLATLLPPKREFFKRNIPILNAIDRIANAALDLRLPKPRMPEGITLERVEDVDNEAITFIESHRTDELLNRGRAEINWMLRNPWLISAPVVDALNARYHFSAVARCFAYHTIKVRDAEGRLRALLILSQRDNSLKLPYLYHDGDLALVWAVVRHELLRLRSATFTVFHADLRAFIRQHDDLSLRQRPLQRHYIVSKVFNNFLGDSTFTIQDGDADCAFT
ncbi:MAG: GNAT family N-acetyltransferase [Flavobacteriales bacterium]|nr:GNAT family N-acetyltransferase [Flavobacteriales bacterium]